MCGNLRWNFCVEFQNDIIVKKIRKLHRRFSHMHRTKHINRYDFHAIKFYETSLCPQWIITSPLPLFFFSQRNLALFCCTYKTTTDITCVHGCTLLRVVTAKLHLSSIVHFSVSNAERAYVFETFRKSSVTIALHCGCKKILPWWMASVEKSHAKRT